MSPSASSPPATLTLNMLTLSLFGLVVTIALVLAYGLASLPQENVFPVLLKGLCLGAVIHTAPLLIRAILSKRLPQTSPTGPGDDWWQSDAFWLPAGVLVLAGLSVLGLTLPTWGLSILGLLAMAGLALGWLRLAPGQRPWWSGLGFIALAFAFGWLFAGMNARAPLHALLQNSISQDALFHTALSHMMLTYDIPSTGLDGTPALAYHYGTHWLFAHLSSLLDISPFEFYTMLFPVLFYPLQFRAILNLITELRQAHQPGWRLLTDWKLLPWIAIGCYFGIHPANLSDYTGWPTNMNLLKSESFSVAVTLAFFALALAYRFARQHQLDRHIPKRFSAIDGVFLLLVVPALGVGMAFCKISVAYLILGTGGYFWLRLGMFKSPWLWGSALLSAGSFLAVYPLLALKQVGIYKAFYHLKRFILKDARPFFFHFNMFWSWLFVGLSVWSQGLRTVGDLWRALVERKLLPVELLLVIAFLGLIPGNVMRMWGGSHAYFIDVQQPIAISLLLGYWPLLMQRAPRLSPASLGHWTRVPLGLILLLFVSYPFLATAFNNIKLYTSGVVNSTMPQLALQSGTLPSGYQQVLSFYPSLMDPALQTQYPERFAVLAALEPLSQIPREEKRRSLVYMPPQNNLFKQLPIANQCYIDKFFIPAFTGLAQIGGFPDVACIRELKPAMAKSGYVFGYPDSHYALDRHTPPIESPEALCPRVRAHGYTQLIYFNPDPRHPVLQRYQCRDASPVP